MDNQELTVEKNDVPATNKRTVRRRYLTPEEVQQLIDTAKDSRNGLRDSTMILVAYKHALRVSELVDLRWSDIHFDTSRIDIKRVKGSISGVHFMAGDEIRQLRRLKAEDASVEFVFVTERRSPFTRAAFQRLVERTGVKAGMGVWCHPHMLRHACGYALANKGTDTRTLQQYMGHANIQNTVRYTHLDANRFKNIWD